MGLGKVGFVLLLGVLCVKCLSDKEILNWRSLADKIQHLPELDEMPEFSMFSGYLEVTQGKSLHYWLNECTDPSSNKLIIWYNGGPGCSSMDGLFAEHGPYKFGSDGRLQKNPYTWNRLAHTLYIESPVGVGFSYSENPKETLDDDKVAHDNRLALENFFLKFPSYRGYEIYISGESYGGVYAPTLVNEIIQDGSWMMDNIRGVIIGNGLLDRRLNSDSSVYFAYYHGLFGESMWSELHRYCCTEESCSFSTFFHEDCMIKVSKVNHIMNNEGLNLYNLYANCASESEDARLRHSREKRSTIEDLIYQSPLSMEKPAEHSNLKLVPVCSNASLLTSYLNKPAVQEAIHVRQKEWEVCNEAVLALYRKIYDDMTSTIKDIMDSLDDVRMLLYFGDIDMACNFMGGEQFFDRLGYEIMTPRRKWRAVAEDGSSQVAGFWKDYDRISFVTVKGAGHMVPTDKPREAYVMLERFLNEEPL
ncbi:unnamed protein product [Clavelina lepadiformis]|uniref:Carboxypeptidase n=1 Tax=Clavelina lepadiformis TaxID=159417 RepID=A0ABP0GML4_CLALP